MLGDPARLGHRGLQRADALLGDRAVGGEVAHEAQHGALARGRERSPSRAHIGDEQVDGVRADVEDSEAHSWSVARGARRGGGVRHPTRYDDRDARRRRSHHAPGTATVTPSLSLYREIDRGEWARLAADMAQPLAETEIVQIRGLGDMLDLAEVREVYLPLSRLLSLYANATKRLGADTSAFLREPDTTTPFVVAVAGSVAVGKSTIARLLRELMSRWPGTPRVELITTDGFLYPNAELERRGLMERKGFPESYDRRALVRFLTDVKSGAPEARAPFYSHMRYDIVPDAHITVRRPDVVIVEGLNVLQPSPSPSDVAVSELFDFSIYVDADTDHIASVVRRPVPRAAARRLLEPELVLQRLLAPLRRRGGADRDGLLERHQPAEPPRERAADEAPGHARAPEGRDPHGRTGAAAQAVTRSGRAATTSWRTVRLC